MSSVLHAYASVAVAVRSACIAKNFFSNPLDRSVIFESVCVRMLI